MPLPLVPLAPSQSYQAVQQDVIDFLFLQSNGMELKTWLVDDAEAEQVLSTSSALLAQHMPQVCVSLAGSRPGRPFAQYADAPGHCRHARLQRQARPREPKPKGKKPRCVRYSPLPFAHRL